MENDKTQPTELNAIDSETECFAFSDTDELVHDDELGFGDVPTPAKDERR